MLVTSSVNNYTTQTNSSTSKKTNDSDYLHRAIRLDVPGEQDKLEFRDMLSGKLIEINVHEAIQRQLQTKFDVELEDDKITKATGELEKYLQAMWSKYQNDTNTRDTNNDGYLDKQELLHSKRVSKIGYDENNKVALSDSKSYNHLEIYGDKAIEEIDNYLKSNGINDGKVSLDMDFNGFIHNDLNLDTNFSNKETLLALDFTEDEINPNKLLGTSGFSAEQTVKKQMEEWIKQLKEKGLEELYGNKSIGETALKHDVKYEELSPEKLIEVKKRVINIQNYLNTQADNARVFSLKI